MFLRRREKYKRALHGCRFAYVGCPRTLSPLAQTTFFRAATGKAFTMVFAGFAFTITSLPKTSRFPALVAGFKRVFTITIPGMVNLPFFTSFPATSARLSKTFLQTDFFTALLVSNAATSSVLLIEATAFAFIAFIAGAICKKPVNKASSINVGGK